MMRFLIAVIIIAALPGCAWWRGVRGVPRAEKAPEEPVAVKVSQPSPATVEAQPLKAVPQAQQAEKTAAPQSLKVDPGFKGIGDQRDNDHFDEVVARKKQDVFSLRGEDRPIRSIKGGNDVESRELSKIYDDLDQRNTRDVFKFR